MLPKPIDELIRAVYLISHPIYAKESLFLPIMLNTCPKSWMKVYWVVIAPGSYEDIGVEHISR